MSSVSHTLMRLWRPAIVYIWNVKKYFRLSNAFRRFSQSLLFALLLMTSVPLIQGFISEKKINYEAVFGPGAVRFTPSEAPPLARVHTWAHARTHTHTQWQMVGLCAAPKQPWISYKMTKMSPMTVRVNWRVSEVSSLYIHKKSNFMSNSWHK